MSILFRGFFIAAISFGIAAVALAQGRHDEKPHGMAAPSTATEDSDRKASPSAGGRHDEKSHGMPKKQKKPKSKEEKSEK